MDRLTPANDSSPVVDADPSVGAPFTGWCAARAGVAGNPSDAIGGAAVAVPVPVLCATVELHDAERLVLRPRHDDGWSSVDELVAHTDRYGHEGGARLVSAAIVSLVRWSNEHGRQIDPAPFELRWSTGAPRSVGLGGSSAIVIATLRALCARWGLHLDAPELAAVALHAEVGELGVAAGWMDRAVQALDAPVLVDTRDGGDVPEMRVLTACPQLELLVAWDPAGASPSGRLHAGLRERAAAREPAVLAAVDALVDAALRAADAIEGGERDELADAVEQTCDARDRLGALDGATRRLVGLASSCSAAATSAGSGGAVLVVPPTDGADQLEEHLRASGAGVVRLRPGRTHAVP